jgi:hypothetical protein
MDYEDLIAFAGITKETAGEVLAQLVRHEIVRCGLGSTFTAAYQSSSDAIRVGRVGDEGGVKIGIDYPAHPDVIASVIAELQLYAVQQKEQLRAAFHGGSHMDLAA